MQDFKNAFMQFDGRDKLTNSFSVLYFPFHGLRFTVTTLQGFAPLPSQFSPCPSPLARHSKSTLSSAEKSVDFRRRQDTFSSRNLSDRGKL